MIYTIYIDGCSCSTIVNCTLNKKEWLCEIRVNLEWTFVLFTHFGVTTGITQGFRVIPEVTPKWVNNTNVHSKFTLISLFSKIHSLMSEHIHSFLFTAYTRWSVRSTPLDHKSWTAHFLFIYLFIYFKSLYRVACSVRDWSSTGPCAIKYNVKSKIHRIQNQMNKIQCEIKNT